MLGASPPSLGKHSRWYRQADITPECGPMQRPHLAVVALGHDQGPVS